MEEGARVDDVYLPGQLGKGRGIVEHISGDELRLEAILILKKFVPNIGAVSIGRRCAIEYELTDLLSKTAAQIQELVAVLDPS